MLPPLKSQIFFFEDAFRFLTTPVHNENHLFFLLKNYAGGYNNRN